MKYLILLFLSGSAFAQTGAGAGITQFIHNGATGNVSDSLGLPVTFSGLAELTVNQGNKGTIPESWYVQPCDGTNCQSFLSTGEGKVSVTQPLPAGSNSIGSVAQDGTWTTGRTWSLLNSTDSVDAVQSGTWNITNISGSISLPTGAATEASQTTGNTSLSSIDTKTPVLVSGRVPVDGSGVTQPVSAASLPLPDGASTSSNQATGNASLSSIDGKIAPLGQTTMSASAPVVIASDQTSIPVSQSGSWSVSQSGTWNVGVTAPSGFSTTGGSSSSQQSFTAPASTKFLLVQGDPANTDSIRFGSVSTNSTTGMVLAPGQDSGLIPFGPAATVFVSPVSGTQKVNITWLF